MAKTKNAGLYASIALAVVAVIVVIVGIVIMNNNKNTEPAGDEYDIIEPAEPEDTSNYETVDEIIELGDYDGMKELSKAIQNGEATGKIVQITGKVSHPMTSYSIVQESADGTEKIGTQFVIEGAEESDYPQDEDLITITGEVVEKESLYFVIQTTPEYIEIQ